MTQEYDPNPDHGSPDLTSWAVPTHRGYTVIPILEFLNGRTWDSVSYAYLQAVRPSCVRVHYENEPVHCDSRTWRVTVCLDKLDLIKGISQEVEVGLYDDMVNGWDVDMMRKGGSRFRDVADKNGNVSIVNSRVVNRIKRV